MLNSDADQLAGRYLGIPYFRSDLVAEFGELICEFSMWTIIRGHLCLYDGYRMLREFKGKRIEKLLQNFLCDRGYCGR